MTTKQGASSPSAEYALRQDFVEQMRHEARRLQNISKAYSRRQWAIAEKVLNEWSTHPDYAAEMTKDEFYCEASRVICDEVQYAIVTTTGETLKKWCEVYQVCANVPATLKRELPFQYFVNARWLVNNHYVPVPMAAISSALDHKLTADEMKRWYTGDDIPAPEVLEFRSRYPSQLWGLYGWLESANGNKEQMEYHMSELVRLHEAE